MFFVCRGRWCMHPRTLHPTAAWAIHRCLPSIHLPLLPLPKAHPPVLVYFTVAEGLLPMPGHTTTPTPCLTLTPSPTTPLPTSSPSSTSPTSPTTPSRPSAPPPVPYLSAGTWSPTMKWGDPEAWCCWGGMIVVGAGFTQTPTLWVQIQVGLASQGVLTLLCQQEPTHTAPYTAVVGVVEVLHQCVHSPPIQQLHYKENWWKTALSTDPEDLFITMPMLRLCWPWGCGCLHPPPRRRYLTWEIPMEQPCPIGVLQGDRVCEETLWPLRCLGKVPKPGVRDQDWVSPQSSCACWLVPEGMEVDLEASAHLCWGMRQKPGTYHFLLIAGNSYVYVWRMSTLFSYGNVNRLHEWFWSFCH